MMGPLLSVYHGLMPVKEEEGRNMTLDSYMLSERVWVSRSFQWALSVLQLTFLRHPVTFWKNTMKDSV